jgi:tripartite-type tricarboxylate transporter receptor subunit TctC
MKVFDPVTFLVDVPSVVFSTAKIPPTSFRELVAHAKANVGKLNYGSPGAGTTPHLAAELINRTHGLGMTHVPFKGAGPAIGSLLAGETHMYLGGAGLGAQHVKAGTLRALAVSGETRLKAYPEIPTFAEAGLGDANSSNWWGIVAPAGTPADIRERFAGAVDQAMKTPKVAAVLDRLDVTRLGDEIEIIAEARSFLHHQVRNMVGTLAEVGYGRRPASWPRAVLLGADRAKAGQTAPPEGLVLTGVRYPEAVVWV